jgi:hypothetical protein
LLNVEVVVVGAGEGGAGVDGGGGLEVEVVDDVVLAGFAATIPLQPVKTRIDTNMAHSAGREYLYIRTPTRIAAHLNANSLYING